MPPPGGGRRGYPLHAAAQDGRLADLAAELTAKHAEGTLAACPSPRPPPNSLPQLPAACASKFVSSPPLPKAA